VWCTIYFDILSHLGKDHQSDRYGQTDGQTNGQLNTIAIASVYGDSR